MYRHGCIENKLVDYELAIKYADGISSHYDGPTWPQQPGMASPLINLTKTFVVEHKTAAIQRLKLVQSG